MKPLIDWEYQPISLPIKTNQRHAKHQELLMSLDSNNLWSPSGSPPLICPSESQGDGRRVHPPARSINSNRPRHANYVAEILGPSDGKMSIILMALNV